MPKIKRKDTSTLEKVRNLFPKVELNSDSEDSFTSDSSNELLQHLPIPDQVPCLTSLSISEVTMEELNVKINRIGELLEALTEKNLKHEQLLTQLNATQSGPSAPAQNATVQPQIRVEDLYRIPDPIKTIPTFDGNRKQLNYWITTAEKTLNLFNGRVSDDLFEVYQTTIINKIEGKAKDIICLAGNPQDFGSVKNILTSALGDRQELSTYKCQLWRNKMTDGTSIHKYYQRSKEILHSIKTIAKQNQKYRDNWDVINSFIEEDGLAAFVAGLQTNYFGHVQAARPKDMEDAYAFLCKFRSQEITAETTRNKPNIFETSKEKSSYKNFQSTKAPYQKENDKPPQIKIKSENTAEPMEIGSTKSKLTLNKRFTLYNNEVCEVENRDNDSEEESEAEIDTNFHLTLGMDRQT